MMKPMRMVERFVTMAPPEHIWRILAEVEHWPSWTSTMLEIRAVGNSELKVGARYRVIQPKLPPAVYEVIECTPNRVFAWVNRFPGATTVADHRLVPLHGGTEVELSVSSEGLLANIVGMMFSRLIREYVSTEARSLKRRCEASCSSA
ncbi:MAG: SRPBCC family protein [Acidobacteria bacterium]|nr:SRPBCC family protein [Acidobacteriota bacterium]